MNSGGSRLAKFMESVNAVTGEAPEAASEQKAKPESKPAPAGKKPPAAAESSAAMAQPAETSPNPWAPLLSAGLKFVEALAATPSGNGGGNGSGSAVAAGSLIETDAKTGRSYLKLPVPEPQVVQQLSDALSRLIAGLGR